MAVPAPHPSHTLKHDTFVDWAEIKTKASKRWKLKVVVSFPLIWLVWCCNDLVTGYIHMRKTWLVFMREYCTSGHVVNYSHNLVSIWIIYAAKILAYCGLLISIIYILYIYIYIYTLKPGANEISSSMCLPCFPNKQDIKWPKIWYCSSVLIVWYLYL